MLDRLQLSRPRDRAQRIVRRMLSEMESFVDRPQLQWIIEVRMMLRRERPAETKSWWDLLVFIFVWEEDVDMLDVYLRRGMNMGVCSHRRGGGR